MQDDHRIPNEETTYLPLLTVQREVGIARATLKKYLRYLGIEPICLHIGTRSLYISREAMAQVARLKQNPASLVQLSPLPLLSERDAQDTGEASERKEA
ncbi:MAG TPA: hypothetical protein VFV38_33715 [Ktedonobacteraceae bacterium]|nr:hypothetical protein [Ktedonobacteraceae bacterium]